MKKYMPGAVILFSLTVLALLAMSPVSRADDLTSGTTTQIDGVGANPQTDGATPAVPTDGTGDKQTVLPTGSSNQKFPNDPAAAAADTSDSSKGGCCG
jgi:hypothetical protein